MNPIVGAAVRDKHSGGRRRAAVRRSSPWRADRGATTVVAVGLVAACIGVVAGLGLAGRAFIVKTHADGVADLAALAAADAARGKKAGEPCAVAKRMVEQREHLKLAECIARPDLGRVTVTVEADLPPPFKTVKSKAVAGAPSPP